MSLIIKTVPDLRDLVEHPERVAELPFEQVGALRLELARQKELEVLLEMRWNELLLQGNGRSSTDGDRRLNVEEAATKLGLSKAWLYRNARRLPFTVPIGRSLGFSAQGIEKYLRQRTGR